MPAWEFLVLRQLKVGDRMLQAGEVTTVPNSWSYRVQEAHLSAGFIEKARLLEDTDTQPQPYPTGAPEGYDDLVPTPPPRVGHKAREKDERWQACWNCLGQNYLPADLDRQVPWQCFACHQTQTLEDRDMRWKQQAVTDVPHESLLGATDHPGVRP
jgi:hypothetical protein